MTSLKSLEKRWYFKFIKHIFIITIIIFVSYNLINCSKRKQQRIIDKQEQLILENIKLVEENIRKIDSISKENIILQNQQKKINWLLDSLYKIKLKYDSIYKIQISSIYDVNAVDHAIWFCTKIDSLDKHSKLPINNSK